MTEEVLAKAITEGVIDADASKDPDATAKAAVDPDPVGTIFPKQLY